MKKISLFICLLLLINSVSPFSQNLPTFDRQRYDIPMIATVMDTGDFNGDKIDDILLINNDVNNTESNIYFYVGNGDGTLNKIITFKENLGHYKYYAINDFNGDGFTDFIYNGVLYLSNRDGTFKDGVTIETEGYQAISGDVDSDGRIDLVTAIRLPDNGKNRHFLKTYFGNGDGTFSEPVSCEIPQFNYKHQYTIDSYYLKYSGDANYDGKPDLLVTALYTVVFFYASDIYVLFGEDNGYYIPSLISGGYLIQSVKDFNNDGFVDIFTSTPSSSRWYRSFVNDGSGNFSLSWEYEYAIPALSRYFYTGDFNGDGFNDIFVNNQSPTILKFLINDKTGKFNELITDFIDYDFRGTSLDLNNDGFDDFVASCHDSSFVEVFINKGKNDSSVLENKPQNFKIYPNSPNPFNSSTTIKIQIDKDTFVKAEIYNLLGQKVKTLISDYLKGGIYNLTWNGTGDSGITLSNGAYILIVKTSDEIKSERLLYLK